MPPPPLRFLTFWSINGPLDRRRCGQQLQEMQALGFDGAVFHPRFYPGRPPYLSAEYFRVLSEVILDARELGMAVWIYDEDGWPSGTVGGEMLSRHPELRQQWVGLYREAPDGGEILRQFEHAGESWTVVRQAGGGVDYLNPELAGRFMELTHERYRFGLSKDAFAHVEAFFCDEPEHGLGHAYDHLPPDGALPWSADLPDRFAARGGGDLIRKLPGLFFRDAGSEEDRIRFREFLAEEFEQGFLAPIDRWCRDHDKRFTAHIKGEEHPLFQVAMVSSCSGVFRRIGLPGIDALERFPGNDFFPRQCSTAARQFGDGRCMAEVFGGAGWGAQPGDLERFLNWVAGHGLTDLVIHLWQYDLSSAAIRDWPASIPVHLNWRDAFPAVLARVKQRLQASPMRPADTLVVTPHRGIMAAFEPWELAQTNVHNAATYPATPAGAINDAFLRRLARLTEQGGTCDFVDELTFERDAVREGGGWRIGAVYYPRVEVAEGARLSLVALEQLAETNGPRESGSDPVGATATEEASWCEVPLRWQSVHVPRNRLLLDVAATGPGQWRAEVEIRESLPGLLAWEFADPVSDLRVDGQVLETGSRDTGVRAVIVPWRGAVAPGRHLVQFSTNGDVQAPFVWLGGQFEVESESAWQEQGRGGLFTAGPLRLVRAAEVLSPEQEWTGAGYGQLTEPLGAEGVFNLDREASSLRWREGDGDAARVWIDGEDCGWSWGPEWRLVRPSGRNWSPGRHAVRVDWVGSTYNVYGPHHYYAGDRHVTSPDQFTGKRNFADPDGAPEMTRVPGWHFRLVRLPQGLQVKTESSL